MNKIRQVLMIASIDLDETISNDEIKSSIRLMIKDNLDAGKIEHNIDIHVIPNGVLDGKFYITQLLTNTLERLLNVGKLDTIDLNNLEFIIKYTKTHNIDLKENVIIEYKMCVTSNCKNKRQGFYPYCKTHG